MNTSTSNEYIELHVPYLFEWANLKKLILTPTLMLIETVQTTIMSGWNKRQISNWSSAGYLKRVQFHNWFRLHQILYLTLTLSWM